MKKIYIVLIVALLATACMGFKSRMKLANKSKMQMTQEDMSDLFVEVHSKVRLQTGTDEPDDLFSVE